MSPPRLQELMSPPRMRGQPSLGLLATEECSQKLHNRQPGATWIWKDITVGLNSDSTCQGVFSLGHALLLAAFNVCAGTVGRTTSQPLLWAGIASALYAVSAAGFAVSPCFQGFRPSPALITLLHGAIESADVHWRCSLGTIAVGDIWSRAFLQAGLFQILAMAIHPAGKTAWLVVSHVLGAVMLATELSTTSVDAGMVVDGVLGFAVATLVGSLTMGKGSQGSTTGTGRCGANIETRASRLSMAVPRS